MIAPAPRIVARDWADFPLPSRGIVAAAQALVELGGHPIVLYGAVEGDGGALRCACANSDCRASGKHPVHAGWQRAPLDAAAVFRELQGGGRNVGWRLGLQPNGSRVVAIDDDGELGELERELGVLPPTLTQRTGSGGSHRFLRVPLDSAIANRVRVAGRAVDVRSDGGQVVLAPSRTPAGRYAITHRGPIAPLPERWLEALATAPAEPAPAPVGFGTWAPGLRNQADRVLAYVRRKAAEDPSLEGSNGSAALARWAGCVFWRIGLNESDGMPLLREMNAIGARPPWSERELRHAAVNGAKPHPSRPERRGHLLEQWAQEDQQHRQQRANRVTAIRRVEGARPDPDFGPLEYDDPIAPTSDDEYERLEREAIQGESEFAQRDERQVGEGDEQATGAPPTNSTSGARRAGGAPSAAQRPEARTDLGNARRLIRLHGCALRYFSARRCWLVWRETRWIPDRTGEVIRRAKDTVESMFADAATLPEDQRSDARKWALASQNAKRLAAMVTLAESEPGVAVEAADLDADPWLLNVRNGLLDLRTGELRASDPAALATKICGAAYDPRARSELWERFLGDLFGDDAELRDYVQRALGYSLFGAWREKTFWFGYGPPDGGKSTFLGVIGDVLGDYHASADHSTWMQQNVGGNRGDLTRLRGARLVTTVEVRASARFDQALMKAVTGGDTLTAAAKYEAEISFAPAFALWFAANDRPAIPTDDEGLWNRVACVPFTRVVPKDRQDRELRAKLASDEHAPAVLAWLVEGCQRWQREGIGTCAAVAAAVSAYRRDANEALGFFEDCLRLEPGVHARCADVLAAYQTWARANGVRYPLGARKLAQRLRQLGATGGNDASRIRGERCWLGVELLDSGSRGGGDAY